MSVRRREKQDRTEGVWETILPDFRTLLFVFIYVIANIIASVKISGKIRGLPLLGLVPNH